MALQGVNPLRQELSQWVRIITYQYSLEPLSCAGSLRDVGGRFNAGSELDTGTLTAWPALYVAEDLQTAFREKFQLAQTGSVDGLTPQELALEHGVSHGTVFVQGRLHSVFDMTTSRTLDAVARVLRRIKMPSRATQIKRKLVIPSTALTMIQGGSQLHDAALKHNWRLLPVQFGLPAPSQTLAELIRAAGFEAILYRSTKGSGKCLAVVPDLLASVPSLNSWMPHRRVRLMCAWTWAVGGRGAGCVRPRATACRPSPAHIAQCHSGPTYRLRQPDGPACIARRRGAPRDCGGAWRVAPQCGQWRHGRTQRGLRLTANSGEAAQSPVSNICLLYTSPSPRD